MFRTATPIALFQLQADILRGHVPGILDGRLDSIHDARIATRRIRELLPLTHEWQRRHVADDLFARIKRIGRALGRVRDADVSIALLRYLESRVPPAAPSLVLVRQRRERERLLSMRKLIKRFERLGIADELTRVSARSEWQRSKVWTALAGGWRGQLRHLVAERAHAASEAVVHATGVYFPNRAHAARIAIKKFRYAIEISGRTGLAADEPLLRTLKKNQDLLGEMHDRQALIDELTDLAEQDSTVDPAQLRLVVRVSEAEIEDLHARAISRRLDVLEGCCRAQQAVRRRSELPKVALALAGAVAAAGIEAHRRHARPPDRAIESAAPDVVSVMIPIPIALDRH
jgi:CHAD domain-containing protein